VNVLFILEYFYPYHGGAEKLFHELTKELSQKGINVTVLTASYDNSPLSETICSVKVIRVRARNRFHFSLNAIAKAVSLAKEADIIHTSTYNAAFPAWIASKIRAKKIVLTVHEYWNELWWQLPFLNLFERSVFWIYEQFILSLSYDRMIAVSNFTANKLHTRNPKSNIVCVTNGQIELKAKAYQEGEFYLFVGRLGVSKGIDILVQSIELCIDNPSIKFKLVIPQTPKTIFKYVISTLADQITSGQVELFHNLDDGPLQSLMNKAKAIIIPSYSEGFGFVAAEASALDIPIIHSGKGALPEVACGRVIEFKNYAATALCDAILSAEKDNFDSKEKISYPIEDAVKSHISLYHSVINHSQ
jgi:D-inositol-3-phosphate glycosyltransferase